MKVALCLSGEPRDFQFIWNDLLSKINFSNIDIFVHAWHSNLNISQLPEHKERGGKNYQIHLNQIKSNQYIDFVKPVDFLVEDYYKCHAYNRFLPYFLPSTITRMYSMFYGIQAVKNLVDCSKYDYIIRLRPDLYIDKNLDWDVIRNLLEINPRSVLMPDLFVNIGNEDIPWSPDSDQWPDFMFIYKADNPIFHDVYDKIQEFCGLHIHRNFYTDVGELPSIPEQYLVSYIRSKGSSALKMDVKSQPARQRIQYLNGQNIF